MASITSSEVLLQQTRKLPKISIGGCRQFNTGKTCPRERTLAGCPYVHNPILRSTATKKEAAFKAAEKAKDFPESKDLPEGHPVQKHPVAIAQSQETPNPPKKIKPLVLKITTTKSRKPAQKENTPIQDPCRFFVRKGCKREQCRYIHDEHARLEFLQLGKEKPVVEMVKSQKRRIPLQLNDSNLPLITPKSTPTLKIEAYQRYSHMVVSLPTGAGRLALSKPKTVEPIQDTLPETLRGPKTLKPKTVEAVLDRNPLTPQSSPTLKPTFAEAVRNTAGSGYPSDNHPTNRNNLLTPPRTPPKSINTTSVILDIAAGPTTSFQIQQSWDLLTFKRWATENLSPAVLRKYLATYGGLIEEGKIPLAALCYTEPRNVKKAKKNTRKPLTEFHIFPHLPVELQDLIWKFHLRREPEQCIITLKRETLGNDVITEFKRRSPIPTAFVVNRHLRELAQRHYKLAFGTANSAPHCYFSFRNDRLFLCTVGALDLLPSTSALDRHDRKQIRLLAVPLRDWIRGNKADFGKAISLFISLRSLTILVGDSKEDAEFTKESARMEEKIRKQVGLAWRILNEPYGRPKPKVHIRIIPALVAKEYGIDGLRW